MKKITQSLLLFYPLPNTHTQKKKKKKKDLHNRTQHTTAHNSTVPPLNPPLTHRLHYSHSKITTFITITKKKNFTFFVFFLSHPSFTIADPTTPPNSSPVPDPHSDPDPNIHRSTLSIFIFIFIFVF